MCEWNGSTFKAFAKEQSQKQERTATIVLSTSGPLLAFYIAAVQFSDLKIAFLQQGAQEWLAIAERLLFCLPILLLIIAMIFAIFVFIPSPSTNLHETSEVITHNNSNLRNSFKALVAALLMLPVVFLIYFYV